MRKERIRSTLASVMLVEGRLSWVFFHGNAYVTQTHVVVINNFYHTLVSSNYRLGRFLNFKTKFERSALFNYNEFNNLTKHGHRLKHTAGDDIR